MPNIPRTASRAAYFATYLKVGDFTTFSNVLSCGFAARGLDGLDGLDGFATVPAPPEAAAPALWAACSRAAFSAPLWIRAASFSLADSRSTGWEYVAHPGLALTAASMEAGSAGPISDSGARSRVQATGVGAPRSFITVAMASPMPSDRITLPRSS